MNKKGFTLVELLAVIAILALLVILALPNVLSMFNNAKKDIFLTEAKNIYKEVSKKYISETMRGNKINKISNKKNKLDMESNNIDYNIKLDDKGNIKNFQVSDGTYCLSGSFSNLSELTVDKVSEGECESNIPKETYCTFDGEMVQGAEYVNGDYTYRYKQMLWENYESTGGPFIWINSDMEGAAIASDTDGWGISLTDKDSTKAVTTAPCTYINDKPVAFASMTYALSKASSIDLSKFNTSNIENMLYMFAKNETSSLDVSHFDTSSVKYTSGMFLDTKVTTLDLSNFDTSNTLYMDSMFSGTNISVLDLTSFDTSKVINMSYMFSNSNAVTIDLSSFNTKNVTSIGGMFNDSKKLETIYASLDFDISKAISCGRMFDNCTSLVGEKGTTYKVQGVDYDYAHIDGGTTKPGYFTSKTEVNIDDIKYVVPHC